MTEIDNRRTKCTIFYNGSIYKSTKKITFFNSIDGAQSIEPCGSFTYFG